MLRRTTFMLKPLLAELYLITWGSCPVGRFLPKLGGRNGRHFFAPIRLAGSVRNDRTPSSLRKKSFEPVVVRHFIYGYGLTHRVDRRIGLGGQIVAGRDRSGLLVGRSS